MKDKKMKEKDSFTRENILKKRTFPKNNTILLIITVLIQIALIVAIVFIANHEPEPDDIIKSYDIDVEPRDDGTLDIAYNITWQAITSEELTWVEIGMANENYSVYEDSLSRNIVRYEKYDDDGYVLLKLYLNEEYSDGDIFDLSFKVRQERMLCRDKQGYFYEFVPGWFNLIPIEAYTFSWKSSESIVSSTHDSQVGNKLVWSGSLLPGGYKSMFVRYNENAFDGCSAMTEYTMFDGRGASNDLGDDKFPLIMICALVAVLIIIGQVFIIDSYVSYVRGRGFITGYGYHYHTYGRVNYRYRAAANAHAQSSGGGKGGFRGSGCACACACACAGGGRAGCSQKDTYTSTPFSKRKGSAKDK